TQFTYSEGAGNGGADGFAMVFQSAGANVVGAAGGSLGYAGINKSFAIEFNIYARGTQGIAFGSHRALRAFQPPGGGVSLTSGSPVTVQAVYNGTAMNVTVSQGSNTFNTSVNVDLRSLLYGPTGYVGFTGGTGGVNAKQDITGFSFVTTGAVPQQT